MPVYQRLGNTNLTANSLVIQNISITGAGIPYDGATAGVNLGQYGITASSVSTAVINFSDGSVLSGAGVSSISGKNIGGGYSIYAINESGTGIFRSISGAGGVSITQSGSGIEIASSLVSGEANTISNTGIAGMSSSAGLYRIKVGVNLELKSLSAGANVGLNDYSTHVSISADSQTGALGNKVSSLESATAGLNSHLAGTDSGTGSNLTKIQSLESSTGTLQTQVDSLWNSKVPYSGATANVNLTTYSLTAGSISSGGGITGTTISAGLLLAGNFQTITASQDSRLSGIESGTGNLQTQVGSLWNSKVPYSGATANLNLTSYSLTAASISALSISSAAISANLLLNSQLQAATADINVLKNIQNNYAVLTANNVFSSSLTAVSISALNITGATVSAGLLLNGQFQTTTADVSILKNIQNNYAVLSANNIFTASITASSISSGAGITGTTISATVLLAGNFQSVTASQDIRLSGLESGTGTLQTQVGSLWNSKVPYSGASASVNLAANSLTAASISSLSITSVGTVTALTLSAGNLRTAKLWFDDGTTQITAPAASSISGKNIGGGYGIYVVNESGTGVFRSISAAGGVTISQSGSGIEISSSLVSGEANTISNTGVANMLSSSAGLYRTKVGVNLELKSLSAGYGIDFTDYNTHVSVSAVSQTGELGTKISSLESATAGLNSHLTGTDSGTGTLQTQIGSLWNSKIPYSGASANLNLTSYSLTAGSISSGGGITGTTISAVILLAGNFQTITASQDSRLSGLESSTSNLQTQVGSLWNSKVPYTGASANVNLTTYGLTAGSISSGGGVTGTTVSAGLLLAGNFQTITASQDSRLSGVESGTGALQTQVGSLWNNKVPYTGTSANVNLTTYSLTAGSISSGAGITGTTISATVLLAGNFQTVTASQDSRLAGLESGTGTLQTQVGSLWNSKVPYTGASANLNLAAYSLTSASISSLSITSAGTVSSLTLSTGAALVTSLSALGGISGGNVAFLIINSLGSISAGSTLSGGNSRLNSLVVWDSVSALNAGISGANAAFNNVQALGSVSANAGVSGTLAKFVSVSAFAGISGGIGSLFTSLSSDGTVSAGNFYTAGSVSAGTISAAGIYVGAAAGTLLPAGSISATTISAGSFVTRTSLSAGTISGSNLRIDGALSGTTISADKVRTSHIVFNDNPTVSISSQTIDFRSITIENPSNAENITVFFTPIAITAQTCYMSVSGSSTPSVTFNWVWDNGSRLNTGSAVGTANWVATNTTTVSSSTLFSNNLSAIPANSFVWLKTTATGGVVNQFHSSIVFTRVR